MKTILALVVMALFAGSVMAQDNTRHMVEFNADSLLNAVLSFSKSKTKGQDSDNDTNLRLNLNYAYSLPMMPNIQVGGRVLYNKATVAGRGDAEDYRFQIGGIYNHSSDLMNSVYASLYLGVGWANTYGTRSGGYGRKDETMLSTLALGKRFDLSHWGGKHVTYSPEIALQNENSTTGSALQYRQDLQLRILQFSVFF
ncbi:MAG: hypothetical protein AB7I27_02820 [Bacteriovoracaceae bacterium]